MTIGYDFSIFVLQILVIIIFQVLIDLFLLFHFHKNDTHHFQNTKISSKYHSIQPIYLPMGYWGNKKNELDVIQNHLPKHFSHFIDICGGGGCVTLSLAHLYPSTKFIFNEINPLCVGALRSLKSPQKLINELNSLDFHSRETYEKIQNDELKISNGAKYFYQKSTTVFGGLKRKLKLDDPQAKNMRKNKWKDLQKYQKYLQNVILSNKPCESVIEEYKNEQNAFIYGDTPYYEKGTPDYDGWQLTQFKHLKTQLDIFQGKWMLHLEQHQELDKLFKNSHTYTYTTEYESKRKSKVIMQMYKNY